MFYIIVFSIKLNVTKVVYIIDFVKLVLTQFKK